MAEKLLKVLRYLGQISEGQRKGWKEGIPRAGMYKAREDKADHISSDPSLSV